MAEVKDPICGMIVDSARAPASGVYAGRTVFFCSAHCKEQYDASHPHR